MEELVGFEPTSIYKIIKLITEITDLVINCLNQVKFKTSNKQIDNKNID